MSQEGNGGREPATTYQSTTVTSYPAYENGRGAEYGTSAIGDFTPTTIKSTRIVQVNPYFDSRYLTTLNGILKLVELLLTLIGFLCSVCSWSSHSFYRFPDTTIKYYNPYGYGSAVWTDIVTSIAFILTLALLILYLFHLVEKLQFFPWNTAELVYCLTVVFCLIIAGAVMIPSLGDGARGAAVFFCWTAAVVYAIDAFFKFRAIRTDQPAQGV